MELKNLQELTTDFIGKMRIESTQALQKAEKEANVLIGILVERGKVTQSEGQRIVNELNSKIRHGRDEFERRFESGSKWALDRLNIPNRGEIDQLTVRVNNLSRKVATLKKRLVV